MSGYNWHINNDKEVKHCKAQGQDACPFGDNPHSDDQQELYKISEDLLAKELGIFKKVEKPKTFKEFYDSNVPFLLKKKGKEQQEILDKAKEEKRALTFDEMVIHEEYVEEITSFLRDNGGETESFYTDEFGLYGKDRILLQNSLVDEMEKRNKNVPTDRKALLGGGMAGAGKTSALKTFKVADPDDYVSINPDDFKEMMAEKGMIPEIPGVLPMEASTLVHKESSAITYQFLVKNIDKGKNIFMDQTIASIKKTSTDLAMCNKNDYKIEGFFVDVTPEVSSQRAEYRYREGTNDYLKTGEGYGGRPVPKFFKDKQQNNNINGYNSKNAENFMRLANIKGLFKTPPRVFDNSVQGKSPVEINITDFKN